MAKYFLVLIPGLVSVVLAAVVNPGSDDHGMMTLALLLVILGSIIAGVVAAIEISRRMNSGKAGKAALSLLAFLIVGAVYFGTCYGGCLLATL